MIEIRRIQPGEWSAAKQIVYRVAHEIFQVQRPLEEMIEILEAQGELKDMDNIQKNYFENDGIFLVTTDDGKMIGTGAVRKYDGDICELKRFWLLTEYHNQGLGYRMLQELLIFAREKGFQRMRLETDPAAQGRAVRFYKRNGFYEISSYSQRGGELAMEMEL